MVRFGLKGEVYCNGHKTSKWSINIYDIWFYYALIQPEMHINCKLLVAQSSCGLDTCVLLCPTRDGFSSPTCDLVDWLALFVPTFSATKDITCYANINHDSRFIIKSVNISIWFALRFFFGKLSVTRIIQSLIDIFCTNLQFLYIHMIHGMFRHGYWMC